MEPNRHLENQEACIVHCMKHLKANVSSYLNKDRGTPCMCIFKTQMYSDVSHSSGNSMSDL